MGGLAGPEAEPGVLPSCASQNPARPQEGDEWMSAPDGPSQGPWAAGRGTNTSLGAPSESSLLSVPPLLELPCHPQEPRWEKSCWSLGGQSKPNERWCSWVPLQQVWSQTLMRGL